MKHDRDILAALAAAEKVYEAVRSNLREGIRESELYSLIGRTLKEEFADGDFEFIGDFISGPRTGGIEGPATERAVSCGESFLLDISIRRGSSWCDTCRTFFLGQPTPQQRKAYQALRSCMEAAEAYIRPGVTGEQIKELTEDLLTQLGFGGRMPHHSGHAVGPFPFGDPVFVAKSREPLKPGMVFTLEPGVYFPGEWGMRIENNYLVTEDGIETLFHYPLELAYFIVEV